jgi:hypothetical protein
MIASDLAAQAARSAYEGARLRRAVVRAGLLGLALALVTSIALGPAALGWIPVFVAMWTLLEWRGTALLRGGRIGAVFGALIALVPTSLFMSCCRLGCSMAAGVCCNSARACAAIGVVVGLGVAAFLSRVAVKERSRATLGAALGIVATAVPRCTGLMFGESVGLLLGLAAGTALAGLLSTVVDRLRQPA